MRPRRSLQQLELDFADLQWAWRLVLDNEPIAWERLVEIHGELLLIERTFRLHSRDLP
jgi:hypothetical protein